MIISLNIETKNPISEEWGATPDNFLISSIIDEHEKNHGYFHTPVEMWDYILTLGKKLNLQGKKLYVYSANHRFDWYIYSPKDDPLIVGISDKVFLYHYREDEETKISRLKKLKKGTLSHRTYIVFLDLFSIYNSSIRSSKSAGLKRVGELIGHEKQEIPPELITKDSVKDLNIIKAYVDNDNLIVIKALAKIKDTLWKEENIKLRTLYSINQIAMNRVMQLLKLNKAEFLIRDKHEIKMPPPKYPSHFQQGTSLHSQFARGGFNYTFKKSEIDPATNEPIPFAQTYKLDLNGFWQYCLSELECPNLATETKIETPLEHTTWKNISKYAGYCDILLESPQQNIPFLPVRIGDINEHPKHSCLVKGQYCINEIDYALKIGYKIKHINYCVIFEKLSKNPFRKVIQDTYKIRTKYENSEFHNWLYKQLGNSFVGKYAQATISEEKICIPAKNSQEYINKGWTIERGLGTYYIASKSLGYTAKSYYAPIIYALTTSESRVRLHKELSKFPHKTLLYSDVDSIITTAPLSEIKLLLNIGAALGQWKIENPKINGVPTAVPTITYKNKFYQFGSIKHASGISLKETNESTNLSQIKRTRMVTLAMAKNESEIGKFITETVTLTQEEKMLQKVYIDKFAECSKEDKKIIHEYIYAISS